MGALNDTWVWDGTNWTQKNPANRPSPRADNVMVYDAARGQVVLFGGWNTQQLLNDTWVWDGTNWTQKNPANSPPARAGRSAAYDAARAQMVVFGGYGGGVYYDDTWVWDGTNWTQKHPANSPPARRYPAVAYDAARGQVVLLGGFGVNVLLNDTWVWDGTNWTQKHPANNPAALLNRSAAYDAVRGHVVVFGGYDGVLLHDDTWVWDGTNWTQKNPANSPPARLDPAMAYDAARGQAVLLGGFGGWSPQPPFNQVLLDDTWVWDVSGNPGGTTCSPLIVPALKQYDSPWGGHTYDSAPTWPDLRPGQNTTISYWGCNLTSAAMIINYHASQQGSSFRTDPDALNTWLTQHSTTTAPSYRTGDVYGKDVENYAKENGVALSYLGAGGKDDAVVENYLCSNNPIILEVSGPHFVVATGQTAVGGKSTFLVNDPGHDVSYLTDPVGQAKYGGNYRGVRKYRGSSSSSTALLITAHSPVELVLTDPSGRRTGFDSMSGLQLNDIPSSAYFVASFSDDVDPTSGFTTPEVKNLEVLGPGPGQYVLHVTGTGAGPFSIDFVGYDNSGNASVQTFAGTVMPGTVAAYDITFPQVSGQPIAVEPEDTTPPSVTAPAPVTVEATGPLTAVALDAANASDESGVVSLTSDAPATFPVGTTLVTWTARDVTGNAGQATQTVTVKDTTPPVIRSAAVAPAALWPPNHQMVAVQIAVSASDLVSTSPTCRVSEIGSNEPVNGLGDGDTAPDWTLPGGLTVNLRAERAGGRSGRVYTLTVACTDSAGNTARKALTVTVPENQEKK